MQHAALLALLAIGADAGCKSLAGLPAAAVSTASARPRCGNLPRPPATRPHPARSLAATCGLRCYDDFRSVRGMRAFGGGQTGPLLTPTTQMNNEFSAGWVTHSEDDALGCFAAVARDDSHNNGASGRRVGEWRSDPPLRHATPAPPRSGIWAYGCATKMQGGTNNVAQFYINATTKELWFRNVVGTNGAFYK